MGGFFGAISKRDCVLDIFFGVDYHSHLGTRRGGMAAYDEKNSRRRGGSFVVHYNFLYGPIFKKETRKQS